MSFSSPFPVSIFWRGDHVRPKTKLQRLLPQQNTQAITQQPLCENFWKIVNKNVKISFCIQNFKKIFDFMIWFWKHLPRMWKRARIKVIKKKQNMGSTLNNARPFFISNTFIGILEACLYPFISQAFNNTNQLAFAPWMSIVHPMSILDKLVR